MRAFPENYNVSLNFGFTDLNGDPITLSQFNAVLYDEEDQVVVDFGSLPFDQVAGSKEVVVPAAFNVLGNDQLEAAFVLRVEMITAQGIIRKSQSYLVVADQRLEVMVNSFQSLEAAETLTRGFASLNGWNVADEDQRVSALIEAYNRLTRIPMCFPDETDDRDLSAAEARIYRRQQIISRDAWSSVTASDFAAFPATFKKTLRMAQLTEANEILEGDEAGSRRRQGIVSETIGESSVTLAKDKLDIGVGSATLKILSGYIYYNYRVVR